MNKYLNELILKTPSVNYEDDPAYIDRFIREEWIGRRISNQHVVKVYEPTRRRRFSLSHLRVSGRLYIATVDA